MDSTQKQSEDRGRRLKVVFVWLAILLLSSFWLTVRGASDPMSLVVIPQVPREGEPIIATFKLKNQSVDALVMGYQFYANGKLLTEGTTAIAPSSGKTYKYAYENSVTLGGRINFVVRSKSEDGVYEKFLSSPPYPPQVWSSFVSFASFSTSVMSFMSSMTYYDSTFGGGIEFNVGILISIVLIGLLIFLELTQPQLQEKTIAILGRLRLRFPTLTWISFIIFMGLVYTRIVMILAT